MPVHSRLRYEVGPMLAPGTSTEQTSAAALLCWDRDPVTNRVRPSGQTIRSDQSGEPAVRVLGAAVLDVEQLVTDRGGIPVLVPLAAVVDRATVPAQLTHRGDHGGGAAGEDLDDLAAGGPLFPLLDGDAAL